MLNGIIYAWILWLAIGALSWAGQWLDSEPGSPPKMANYQRVYLQLAYLTVLGAVIGHFISWPEAT